MCAGGSCATGYSPTHNRTCGGTLATWPLELPWRVTTRAQLHCDAAIACHTSRDTPANAPRGTHAPPHESTRHDASVLILGAVPGTLVAMIDPGSAGPRTAYFCVFTPSSPVAVICHTSALSIAAASTLMRPFAKETLKAPCVCTSAESGGRGRRHWLGGCGGPVHPLGHANIAVPTVFAINAPAGTCRRATQHTCARTHREHRSLPQVVHNTAAVTFVNNWDMLGAHAHPIPAGALVWLHSIAAGSPTFSELCGSVPALFFSAVNRERNINRDWFLEACTVVGRYAGDCDTDVALPAYAIQAKSPAAVDRPQLLDLAARAGSTDADQCNVRAASLLLYHLSLVEIADRYEVIVGERSGGAIGYARLAPLLRHYSHECTFSVTGDHFLHVCLRMHLPSWCTMLSLGGCYADLADLLGGDVNNVVRPYVDLNVASFMQTADAASDNVVLFVVVCTLIAEIAGLSTLQVLYNRDVLFAPPGIACPFVLCDFPVAGIVTDAFGFVTKEGSMVVCNGLTTVGAISLWVETLDYGAPVVASFLDGTADASNPLRKYETV